MEKYYKFARLCFFYWIREREAHMRALKDIITVAGSGSDGDAGAEAAVIATNAASTATETWAFQMLPTQC